MTDNKIDILQQMAEELAEFETMETEVDMFGFVDDQNNMAALRYEMEGL